MSGHDYPIEHFQLMLDVSRVLKDFNAQLLEHEYHYHAFGSWWFVIESSGKKCRLLFDGRDFRLVLERDISNGIGWPDWKEHAAEEMQHNSKPTISEIIAFLRANLFMAQ
jgi:hypothetical protein